MSDAPSEPTTPLPTSQYTSAQPTQEYAYAGEPTPPKKRGGAGMVVLAAAVAAIVGGASGAGIAVAVGNHNDSTNTSSGAGPTSITVNDKKNATAITAVAAKAAPSVVTINQLSAWSLSSTPGWPPS